MPTKTTIEKGAPGQWLKRSADRTKVARIVLNHAHILQIVDDHQLMYYEAIDDDEREQVRARCRTQVWLAGAHAIGFDVAVHGAVGMMFDPMLGGAVLLLGAIIAFFTDRGH